MTTTEIPLADRFTIVTVPLRDGSSVTLCAERTPCPFLVITPVISEGGLTERVVLTHMPTGRTLPGMLFGTPERLRELAAKVVHLNWDFTAPDAFPIETRKGFLEARKEIEFGEGEEIFTDYPDGWGKGPGSIPGDADGMVQYFLDGWQASYDRMHRDHPEKIPMDGPDEKPNWEWLAALLRQADTFGLVYLLAALRRVAPETANHAAAWLAGQWASGDSIGEWVWQWRDEIEKGEPLKLPAVPSPGPAEGELFS